MNKPSLTVDAVMTPSRAMQLPEKDLLNWMQKAGLAGAGAGEALTVHQFNHGQSNPTYKLGLSSGRQYVLRKRPPGKLLKQGAHRVDREAAVLRALQMTAVAVPRLYSYCDDAHVVGTPFYVCELVEGMVYPSPLLESLSPPARSAAYSAMARTLAHIHAVDVRAVGLGHISFAGANQGKRYNTRQVRTWTRQYEAGVATHASAQVHEMDTLAALLAQRVPEGDAEGQYGGRDCGPRLVHGDYRLDNLIFDRHDPSCVKAVLDWELATLGDPVADLAYACIPFHVPREGFLAPFALGTPEQRPAGVPSEENFLATYHHALKEASAGAPVPAVSRVHWTFYLALGMFRMASIASGVYVRSLLGNASQGAGGRARMYGDAVPILARRALLLLEGATPSAPPAAIGMPLSPPGTGFAPTVRCQVYLDRLRAFVDEVAIPAEARYIHTRTLSDTLSQYLILTITTALTIDNG